VTVRPTEHWRRPRLGMTAGPLRGGVLAGAGGTRLAMSPDAGQFALVAIAATARNARRAPAPAPLGRPIAAAGDRDGRRDGIVSSSPTGR